MKKHMWLAAAALVLLVLFASCNPETPLNDAPGKVRVVFAEDDSRSIESNISLRTEKYRIEAERTDAVASLEPVFASKTDKETILTLDPGTWTISVYAVNASGVDIGSGSATVTVAPGESKDCPVTVKENDGTGSFQMRLRGVPASWNLRALLMTDLSDQNPVEIPLFKAGDAHYGSLGLQSGSYLVRILNGSSPIWVEAIRIVKGGETNADVFVSPEGRITVKAAPDAAKTVVSCPDASDGTIMNGGTYTFSSTVPSAWYVDGAAVKGGNASDSFTWTPSSLADGSNHQVLAVPATPDDFTMPGVFSVTVGSSEFRITANITEGTKRNYLMLNASGVPSGVLPTWIINGKSLTFARLPMRYECSELAFGDNPIYAYYEVAGKRVQSNTVNVNIRESLDVAITYRTSAKPTVTFEPWWNITDQHQAELDKLNLTYQWKVGMGNDPSTYKSIEADAQGKVQYAVEKSSVPIAGAELTVLQDGAALKSTAGSMYSFFDSKIFLPATVNQGEAFKASFYSSVLEPGTDWTFSWKLDGKTIAGETLPEVSLTVADAATHELELMVGWNGFSKKFSTMFTAVGEIVPEADPLAPEFVLSEGNETIFDNGFSFEVTNWMDGYNYTLVSGNYSQKLFEGFNWLYAGNLGWGSHDLYVIAEKGEERHVSLPQKLNVVEGVALRMSCADNETRENEARVSVSLKDPIPGINVEWYFGNEGSVLSEMTKIVSTDKIVRIPTDIGLDGLRIHAVAIVKNGAEEIFRADETLPVEFINWSIPAPEVKVPLNGSTKHRISAESPYITNTAGLTYNWTKRGSEAGSGPVLDLELTARDEGNNRYDFTVTDASGISIRGSVSFDVVLEDADYSFMTWLGKVQHNLMGGKGPGLDQSIDYTAMSASDLERFNLEMQGAAPQLQANGIVPGSAKMEANGEFSIDFKFGTDEIVLSQRKDGTWHGFDSNPGVYGGDIEINRRPSGAKFEALWNLMDLKSFQPLSWFELEYINKPVHYPTAILYLDGGSTYEETQALVQKLAEQNGLGDNSQGGTYPDSYGSMKDRYWCTASISRGMVCITASENPYYSMKSVMTLLGNLKNAFEGNGRAEMPKTPRFTEMSRLEWARFESEMTQVDPSLGVTVSNPRFEPSVGFTVDITMGTTDYVVTQRMDGTWHGTLSYKTGKDSSVMGRFELNPSEHPAEGKWKTYFDAVKLDASDLVLTYTENCMIEAGNEVGTGMRVSVDADSKSVATYAERIAGLNGATASSTRPDGSIEWTGTRDGYSIMVFTYASSVCIDVAPVPVDYSAVEFISAFNDWMNNKGPMPEKPVYGNMTAGQKDKFLEGIKAQCPPGDTTVHSIDISADRIFSYKQQSEFGINTLTQTSDGRWMATMEQPGHVLYVVNGGERAFAASTPGATFCCSQMDGLEDAYQHSDMMKFTDIDAANASLKANGYTGAPLTADTWTNYQTIALGKKDIWDLSVRLMPENVMFYEYTRKAGGMEFMESLRRACFGSAPMPAEPLFSSFSDTRLRAWDREIFVLASQQGGGERNHSFSFVRDGKGGITMTKNDVMNTGSSQVFTEEIWTQSPDGSWSSVMKVKKAENDPYMYQYAFVGPNEYTALKAGAEGCIVTHSQFQSLEDTSSETTHVHADSLVHVNAFLAANGMRPLSADGTARDVVASDFTTEGRPKGEFGYRLKESGSLVRNINIIDFALNEDSALPADAVGYSICYDSSEGPSHL